MTPLAQWAVKNYTPEVRNVGTSILQRCLFSRLFKPQQAPALESRERQHPRQHPHIDPLKDRPFPGVGFAPHHRHRALYFVKGSRKNNLWTARPNANIFKRKAVAEKCGQKNEIGPLRSERGAGRIIFLPGYFCHTLQENTAASSGSLLKARTRTGGKR